MAAFRWIPATAATAATAATETSGCVLYTAEFARARLGFRAGRTVDRGFTVGFKAGNFELFAAVGKSTGSGRLASADGSRS
jgi:hypothetical protein